MFVNMLFHVPFYNLFLVYCRELALGTVSLTYDRAQGDDSKHDSHYSSYACNGPGVNKNLLLKNLFLYIIHT